MKNKTARFLLALVLCGILLFVLMHGKQSSSPALVHPADASNTGGEVTNNAEKITAKTSALPAPIKAVDIEQQKQNRTQSAMLWRTPLLYYGKVVDENGNPIPGVQVSYGGNSLDESLTEEEYNKGSVVTDDRGYFKIDGVRGIGLMFELSHSNYYAYPDNSTGFDVRSRPIDGIIENSEATARLFRMHSKGNPIPLIFRSGGFHAPNNGSTASYPLRGNTRAEILGQLQIQCWSGVRSDTNLYDWEVQLTLPEGGIVESTNYFDFTAPETGYSKSVDFQVSGSEMAKKKYFLKLPSGYVRFKLQVIMGKDLFVSGDYYFNPDGSRNLEVDYSRIIRPTQ